MKNFYYFLFPSAKVKAHEDIRQAFEESAWDLIEASMWDLIADGDVKNLEIIMTGKPELLNKRHGIWSESVLHKAISAGKEEVVKLFLKLKPDLIYSEALIIGTPFNKVIYEGDEKMVRLLLNFKPDLIDTKCYFGRTPITRAISEGHKSLVKLLLDFKPELINKIDDYGKTLLHHAVDERRTGIAKLLLKLEPKLIYAVNNKSETVLYLAAEKGNVELVSLFLDLVPKLIDIVTNDNETILHGAVKGWEVKILEIILKLKPEFIDFLDKKGQSAFYAAADSYVAWAATKYLQNKIPVGDVIDIFTKLKKADYLKGFRKLVIDQSTTLLAEVLPCSLANIVQEYIPDIIVLEEETAKLPALMTGLYNTYHSCSTLHGCINISRES